MFLQRKYALANLKGRCTGNQKGGCIATYSQPAVVSLFCSRDLQSTCVCIFLCCDTIELSVAMRLIYGIVHHPRECTLVANLEVKIR